MSKQQIVTDIKSDLQDMLAKKSLTRTEVKAGIKDCFTVCQYDFLKRRQPDISIESVQSVADDLVETVFTEEGITPPNTTPTMLKHIVGILDRRFEFMQDPELRAKHQHVIDELIRRLKKHE